MPFTFEPNTCIDCGYNPPCEWHERMEEESDRLNYPRPNEPEPARWGKEYLSDSASHIRQRQDNS